MDERQSLTETLIAQWQPQALLVYGSFADGSQDTLSDFDALAITDKPAPLRDQGELQGRRLDIWFLHPNALENLDASDWPQLYHAVPVYDPNGIGIKLISDVRSAIDAQPLPTSRQNTDSLEWLDRMLDRSAHPTPEGRYRLLWLLTDSLEIWCDLTGKRCFGPKKSMALLRETDPKGFDLYESAIRAVSTETATLWINHLHQLFEEGSPWKSDC
ncbi:MAG: hypothetical protein IK127_03905 [Clostridia bacterium]|nr:hypothetical protein [Clostridia bacterium]